MFGFFKKKKKIQAVKGVQMKSRPIKEDADEFGTNGFDAKFERRAGSDRRDGRDRRQVRKFRLFNRRNGDERRSGRDRRAEQQAAIAASSAVNDASSVMAPKAPASRVSPASGAVNRIAVPSAPAAAHVPQMQPEASASGEKKEVRDNNGNLLAYTYRSISATMAGDNVIEISREGEQNIVVRLDHPSNKLVIQNTPDQEYELDIAESARSKVDIHTSRSIALRISPSTMSRVRVFTRDGAEKITLTAALSGIGADIARLGATRFQFGRMLMEISGNIDVEIVNEEGGRCTITGDNGVEALENYKAGSC